MHHLYWDKSCISGDSGNGGCVQKERGSLGREGEGKEVELKARLARCRITHCMQSVATRFTSRCARRVPKVLGARVCVSECTTAGKKRMTRPKYKKNAGEGLLL